MSGPRQQASGPGPGCDPIADTRRWLERAVIGLNLCPFAKAVYVRDQVRFVLSTARTAGALRVDLVHELEALASADPALTDTTLIIHPHVLQSFDDYNDFLDVADAAIAQCGLEGELQVASFHPDYRFAGTAPDDIDNCTNRSPWPMLHLLRERSVARAVEAFPDPDAIVSRNLATLRWLGHAGWRALLDDERAPD